MALPLSAEWQAGKGNIGPYPAIPIAEQSRGGETETKGARTYHAEYQALVAAGKSPARGNKRRRRAVVRMNRRWRICP